MECVRAFSNAQSELMTQNLLLPELPQVFVVTLMPQNLLHNYVQWLLPVCR